MMTAISNPYSDIIHLPHHKSPKRKEMSLYDRAAQFSPFAALTGFDGVIAETGRTTGNRVELSESEKGVLDQKLTLIDVVVQDMFYPVITVIFFVSDALKEGGKYEEFTGPVYKIDTIERTMTFLAENDSSADKVIRIDDIAEIHGDLVDYMDEA